MGKVVHFLILLCFTLIPNVKITICIKIESDISPICKGHDDMSFPKFLNSSTKGIIQTDSVAIRSKRSVDLLDPFLSKPQWNLPFPSQVLDELFGRRLFNTTMNYIIPLFEVGLPVHTDQGSTVHLAMQAFLGLFSAIAWIATVAIPVIFTELVPFGLRKRNSNGNLNLFESRSSSLPEVEITSGKISSLFNDKMRKQIGLEWSPCLSKTICEAYRSPKRFGIIALPFRILFPIPLLKSSIDLTNEEKAAYLGSQNETECGEAFKCFFDVLELTQYLAHSVIMK